MKTLRYWYRLYRINRLFLPPHKAVLELFKPLPF